jgi:hypothetical protein
MMLRGLPNETLVTGNNSYLSATLSIPVYR